MRYLIDTYIQAEDPRIISDFGEVGLLDLIVKSGIADAVNNANVKCRSRFIIKVGFWSEFNSQECEPPKALVPETARALPGSQFHRFMVHQKTNLTPN